MQDAREAFRYLQLASTMAAEAGRGGIGHLSGAQVALVLVTAIALIFVLATVQLWGERRRLRRDLAVAVAGRLPFGLPRGSRAPDFRLTPMRGTFGRLSDLTDRERPAVLVFLSTGCGSCRGGWGACGRATVRPRPPAHHATRRGGA